MLLVVVVLRLKSGVGVWLSGKVNGDCLAGDCQALGSISNTTHKNGDGVLPKEERRSHDYVFCAVTCFIQALENSRSGSDRTVYTVQNPTDHHWVS